MLNLEYIPESDVFSSPRDLAANEKSSTTSPRLNLSTISCCCCCCYYREVRAAMPRDSRDLLPYAGAFPLVISTTADSA